MINPKPQDRLYQRVKGLPHSKQDAHQQAKTAGYSYQAGAEQLVAGKHSLSRKIQQGLIIPSPAKAGALLTNFSLSNF
ncbi:hypothetical protein [Escherichia coli]|uniref:hypothetical protein n=1 Tax=Escherichia coli TaxID=562 RepID=UPI00201EBD8B|nr:hypothetical protein [Escherichia coli]